MGNPLLQKASQMVPLLLSDRTDAPEPERRQLCRLFVFNTVILLTRLVHSFSANKHGSKKRVKSWKIVSLSNENSTSF